MTKYSDEFKEKALKRTAEIGVVKTSKELHVGDQTLYRWKKAQRAITNAASQIPDTQSPDNSNILINTEEVSEYEKKQSTTISGIEEELKQELNDLRQINQIAQQTIDCLVKKNHQLQECCKKYLETICLMSQQ